MRIIETITADALQEQILPIDGTSQRCFMTLEFKPNQSSWYYSFTFGDFSVSNERLVVSPNLIRQYKNLLPFGLLLYSASGIDPIHQDSFSSGEAVLNILSAAEVAEVETTLYG